MPRLVRHTIAAFLVACLVAAPALALPAIEALPAPPAPGSAAEATDRAAMTFSYSAERIAEARRDRSLDPFTAFGPILGDAFAADALPATRRILGAVQAAVSRVMVAAKGIHPRTRPYAVDEAFLRCPGRLFLVAQRSYPSGHAATGEAWAVVLAALLPQHAAAILARGADYGTSRVVCGFHWPSDVAAGQAIGAAVAAELLADPAFARLIAKASEELAPLR
ncbi:MAG: phosphatase PAP2 family protein [Bauldia sp.]|nr:phosphatase PAP2 family protein [Bauldia sp.]